MTAQEALVHTGKEAATGAAATAAGAGLAAVVVALTGGLAAPIVFLIGAGGAVATKTSLRALFG